MPEINGTAEVGIWKLMNEQDAGFLGGTLYSPLRGVEKAFARKVDGAVDGVKNNAVSINEIDTWEGEHGRSLETMHLRSRVMSAKERSLASIVWSKVWIGTVNGLQKLTEKLLG